MRVIIIGAKGMLGRELMTVCQVRGHEVIGYALPEVDITKIEKIEGIEGCDWVINCAAYTDVDKAEEEPTKAFEVNACGAGRISRICKENKCGILQVSTDYIFDGMWNIPYKENDQANPLNTYGMSKHIGETLSWRENSEVLIIRTQCLFGKYGENFVRFILNQVEAGKKELDIIDDQVMCPTYVGHLAEAMLFLMEKDIKGETVHVSSEGFCSWCEFAKEILKVRGIKDILVKPIKAEDSKSKAIRPRWSVLDKDLYRSLTGKDMPTWQESLREYLRNEV